MFLLTLLYALIVIIKSDTTDESEVELLFSHYRFECDPNDQVYETSFTFLNGLGHGFVHAEAKKKIFFEYYFPSTYWVGFATADQSIQGVTDECTTCYFNNYYPSNQSNLYPKCIEECLDDTIFVATVNSDQQNINDWNLIEFQIVTQESKILHKKMYRIPQLSEILALWGSESYPYRQTAHFETDIFTVGQGVNATQYIHAKFWRNYDFVPSDIDDEYDQLNEWKPFVKSQEGQHTDSLCFISIGSFDGGAYPYDDDTLQGLPGFYIDTQHSANIHCYKLDDIKRDCGQDWSALKLQKDEIESIPGSVDGDTDSDTLDDMDTDNYIYDDTDGDTDNGMNYDVPIQYDSIETTTSPLLSTTEWEKMEDTDISFNDLAISSHDFIFVNFNDEWDIDSPQFTAIWNEAVAESQRNYIISMTQPLYINCVSFEDICSSIESDVWPSIRIYKRDRSFGGVYYGGGKLDHFMDFVKAFIRSNSDKIETPAPTDDIEEYYEEVDDIYFDNVDLTEQSDTYWDYGYSLPVENEVTLDKHDMTTTELNDISIDEGDDMITDNYNNFGLVILIMIGMFGVVLFVQICIVYYWKHKNNDSDLLDKLETMKSDNFGEEGVVSKDISTVVTIGLS